MKKSKSEDKTKPAKPCVLIIFGASGDLAKRKLIPALFNLGTSKLLPENFAVVGIGRRDLSKEEFRNHLSGELCDFVSCEINPRLREWLKDRLYYVRGNIDDPNLYKDLNKTLAEIDAKHKTGGNYLFYLSVPPSLFGKAAQSLAKEKLTLETNGNWRRIIIEKPFGRDLKTATKLNQELQKHLAESQIYRIDHYLGKETVQNILVFRFANGIFEPIWNRRYIDHVQITVSEQIGVGHRAAFYEEAGALRDMVPNHIFQILSYITMEPPYSFDSEAVQNEKAKVLQSIKPIPKDEVLNWTVRGQYSSGMIEGEAVPSYRKEPKINPKSNVETFVAMKLMLDNWRWADVPFYIRTGKRMAKRVSEIAIFFKKPPYTLFRDTPVEHLETNVLIIRIQPDEGISLSFGAKVPGPLLELGNMKMDFSYCDYFEGRKPFIGYETLLLDCMKGDSTLFLRSDNVELAWKNIDSILEVWKNKTAKGFPNYKAGSWGPQSADQLLAKDGRHWRND